MQGEADSIGVLIWWASLSAVSVLNLAAWFWFARRFNRDTSLSGAQRALRLRALLLSGGYVAICAFRSILPRADVQRICLYDSWLSSVMVGRTVATIAELCFVAQWALLVREIGESKGSRLAVALSYGAVPVIAVAETFSWYAVLSTNYLGNVVEESIWAMTGAALALSLAILWRRCRGPLQHVLSGALACSLMYVTFMCLVDVPMYVSRWRADEAAGRSYLSLSAGIHDVATRWIVVRSWSEWGEEMPWMTLYFTVAVWISIALLRLPPAWLRGTDPSTPRSTSE